jgi:hypothetical protein
MKNTIISGLLGGIVIFLLGGLFYANLFADFFAAHVPAGMENVRKELPNVPVIAVADIMLGVFLAIVFNHWAKVRGFSKGAMLGLIIGLGITLNFNLIFSATTNLSTPMSGFVDVCISTFNLTIGGGVIGAMLGKLDKSPTN